MLPTVLLTHPLPADWLRPLEGRVRLIVGPEDAIGFPQPLLEFLPEAEGLITLLTDRVDAKLLEHAPKLRVVSNMAVGVDNIDLQACQARGIAVGNTPGVLTEATADLTLALILSAARNLPQAAADARCGKWKTWSPTGWLGLELNGAILGILGMGKIGQAVARRAHAFGLHILYTSPHAHAEVEHALGARRVTLETLLESSDILSLHCPLTPETRGLIDEAALRRMKPQAILVNVARGPVVVTEALVRALREGWIAGAALDVTDPEPLPPDHPLYSLPNCLIVPHIGSATWETRRRMAAMACENLLAGLGGRPLPYAVTG
uniref:2-hydroxyacid dehydrogenase n=1 Tax=uncultured prokaryote TaxID=198431 RepID=H5SM05_9ZZZZ|nr:2-hydroxyacid dehydrogenase [uncultured prokaryote]